MTNLPIKPVQDKDTEALDKLMAQSRPSQRELIRQRLAKVYPSLEAYLRGGKPIKGVLAAFNKLANSKVSPRTFNEWMETERQRHAEIGDVPCCPTCSRPLVLHASFGSSAESSALSSQGDEE